MCSKPILLCSRVATKGKNLLEAARTAKKVASNAIGCLKGAEHNQNRLKNSGYQCSKLQ